MKMNEMNEASTVPLKNEQKYVCFLLVEKYSLKINKI